MGPWQPCCPALFAPRGTDQRALKAVPVKEGAELLEAEPREAELLRAELLEAELQAELEQAELESGSQISQTAAAWNPLNGHLRPVPGSGPAPPPRR